MARILVIPRTEAPVMPQSGCWPVRNLDFMQKPLWRKRASVEHDENLLQPIVYLVLLDALGQAWCYQRTGGDARVDGRWSCGVGGHVDHGDAADACAAVTTPCLDTEVTLRQALMRELSEELHGTAGALEKLSLRGLIYEGLSAIGRVHLGVLYTAQWTSSQPPQARAGEALRACGFMPLRDIAADARFELWSQLAARHLMDAPSPQ